VLMELEFYRQILEECSNIKFHESRVVPCGQTDINMTKPTFAFCNFANAPKKYRIVPHCFFYRSDLFPFRLTALLYRGADKSLARPGSKQATVTEDF